MKKLIFLLLVFAGFMACENESIQDLPEETSVTEGINARLGDKIDVCHYDAENDSWHVINISVNAWEGHEKHGDVMLVDADGDGWVSNANECVPGGDCDDADPNVNPGMEEICGNGIDDNCNGEVDEGCVSCDVGCANVTVVCDRLNTIQFDCVTITEFSLCLRYNSNSYFCLSISPRTESCKNYILQYIDENNIPNCDSGGRTIQPSEKDFFIIE